MKLQGCIFILFAALNLSAVELDGRQDFIRINWKTEMPRPVYAISFRVKVDSADLTAISEDKSSICFEMRSNPLNFNGFREFKFFFVSLKNPLKSYAGFQAANTLNGKTERIRYNTAWRGIGGTVATDQFVTVVISFDGMTLDVFVDHMNLAHFHKKQFFSDARCAEEYTLSFGMNKYGRYPLKCEIRDIAVYDKALSRNDVQLLLKNRTPAGIIGVLAYFPLQNDETDYLNCDDMRIIMSDGIRKQMKKH